MARRPSADDPHDPSWVGDRAGFCAALGDLGVSYDSVNRVCDVCIDPVR